jgi:hypothetical protein
VTPLWTTIWVDWKTSMSPAISGAAPTARFGGTSTTN